MQTTTSEVTRPVIETAEAEFHALADQGWDAIVEQNDPPAIFVRGRNLVYVADDGREGVMLDEHNRTTMRDLMSRTALWQRTGAKGEPSVVHPSKDAADTVLAWDSARYVGVGRVDRVVDVPVFARDGSLLTTPGYHEAARVYYAPASGLATMPTVTGDEEDTREALAWIRSDLFADFPFVDDADFAHALALFLLPFARDLIDGLTPMHSVLAPTPGSGKDALVDTALRPSCGVVPKTPEIKSDDEMRKQITAHLLAGASALVFDNIKTDLDSGALAAALTADVWRDRQLQQSKSVALPIRNVWALTANNLHTTTEQARRMVPVFLDAGVERPDKRHFKRDLDSWIPANRAEAVWCALTIIKSWLRADDPLDREHLNQTFDDSTGKFTPMRGTRLLNSYAAWSRVMGGILDWVGVPGFLENHDKMFMYADDEDAELVGFLAAWHTTYPEPYSTKQLASVLWEINGLYGYLPPKLRDARSDERTNLLGQTLRHAQDRVFGSYKVVKHDGRPRTWQVIKVG